MKGKEVKIVELQELKEVSKPLMKWLNENSTPHTKIIIDCNTAEVVSG